MRVLYDRVAAIDVHKDMVKVAVRVPGAKRGTRKTDVLEFRTFYGVLQEMGRELRRRGVTHVVMEASGIYTEPVYYALAELDFAEVLVVNPAHVKALKGRKTDAKDAVRLLDLYECGAVVRGSYIPSPDLKEVRDLARYRVKTVQARTSEIQRLQKTLESAGIKLSSVVSDVTGASATAMIEALIDGERRGRVLADLAQTRLRTAGKMADLSMALAGRFTEHHALMCRLHLDQIGGLGAQIAGLDEQIAARVARYSREAALLTTVPGFGDVVVAGWLGAIGPAPHQHFATAQRLASWATLCPGNYMSAKKSKGGRTGDGGAYIKPLLVQAAWAAIRVPGRHPGPIPPPRPPVRRPQEQGRAETSHRRHRPHPAQNRLPHPENRPPLHRPRRQLLRQPRNHPDPAGLPHPPAPQTQPRLPITITPEAA